MAANVQGKTSVPRLQVRGIKKAFGQNVVLKGIDLSVHAGEAIALIARQNRITVEELKEHYSADLESAVIRSVLTTKAMEFIRAHAEIVEE